MEASADFGLLVPSMRAESFQQADLATRSPQLRPPRPGRGLAQLPADRKALIRTDAAGGMHEFVAWTHHRLHYSVGFPVTAPGVAEAVRQVPALGPAYDADGTQRDGAWIAELTGLLDLSGWPPGLRVIARNERPQPGAQLRLTDVDGHRVTCFEAAPAAGSSRIGHPPGPVNPARPERHPGARPARSRERQPGQLPRPPAKIVKDRSLRRGRSRWPGCYPEEAAGRGSRAGFLFPIKGSAAILWTMPPNIHILPRKTNKGDEWCLARKSAMRYKPRLGYLVVL